jgi:L-aspartate semialdehyde sulfurtransferase
LKSRSITEINEKIAAGKAVVFTAEELSQMAKTASPQEIFNQVDVVTTGTFGAMCSSGAFVNFGHAEPPIRMESVTLNNVPVFAGIAAVDAYIGATEPAADNPHYGGAHIIEALIRGEKIHLKAKAKGTDCYPRKEDERWISKETVNELYLYNPRNAYQNYVVAVNSSDRVLHTYMGRLLPLLGNAAYSTSGELSPLINDPELRTIGIGTRIFLGGAQAYISWRGTQFRKDKAKNAFGIPLSNSATLAVTGDMKQMSSQFIRAAYIKGYGVTLFVGLGIPIPILDEDMARRVSISNREIEVEIFDYSDASRPVLGRTNYADLQSGSIEIGKKRVRSNSVASLKNARLIAEILKSQIRSRQFLLSTPVAPL